MRNGKEKAVPYCEVTEIDLKKKQEFSVRVACYLLLPLQ